MVLKYLKLTEKWNTERKYVKFVYQANIMWIYTQFWKNVSIALSSFLIVW